MCGSNQPYTSKSDCRDMEIAPITGYLHLSFVDIFLISYRTLSCFDSISFPVAVCLLRQRTSLLEYAHCGVWGLMLRQGYRLVSQNFEPSHMNIV
jgi:hypothetical protein